MKSSRNRRMSHTSTSSSSESSEEGELTTSHRIRMSSRKHRSRPHTPDHSTERRRRQSSAEITQDHTWGSSSINVTKKFDKRYEDADNLGSAASASRNEFVDSKRPRLDYGDVGDVPVASSDTFGTGGT